MSLENQTFVLVQKSDQYDEYFHISFGEKLIKEDPRAASYCGLFEDGDNIRAIIYLRRSKLQSDKKCR